MRLAILGTGLIGGSIGLAAVRAGVAEEIVLWDPDPACRTGALDRGAGTSTADSLHEAVASADVILIAAPVDAIVDVIRSLEGRTQPGAVVSDVGSSKGRITEVGAAVFGPMFVGGHPMAGSERNGISAATPDLFEGASWILTPGGDTSPEVYGALTGLVAALGAQAVALPVGVHDTLLAQISHLPQIVASLLVDLVADGTSAKTLLPLAGGGFRDVTRIAASDPAMWLPILKTNREAIVEALVAFDERIQAVVQRLSVGDWSWIDELLATSRTARLELFQKASLDQPTCQLSLLIPDRPGVLAEVTTAAGELGVNLEDLRIFHSTEGGRGRLDLEVTGTGDADLLQARLMGLGYHVFKGWHE
jgi:prephenate dehydrogenase